MIRAIRWLPWTTRAAPPREAERPLDLEAVHAEHVDFVWASLQRLGVREPDLQDLTQDVFMIVHDRLHTFDASLPMPPWLFGICRKVAAAHRRKAYVRREKPTAAVADDQVQGGPGPEDAAQARQARARLDSLLDELDPEKRAVLVMFEIDELPCETIAVQLGIPVGTVYSRLHSARKAFEKALERSRARDARLAAVPVAAGLLATLKGVAAAAGIGAGSALVLIGAVTLVEARLDSASSPSAAPAVSAPGAQAPTAPAGASPDSPPSSHPAIEQPPEDAVPASPRGALSPSPPPPEDAVPSDPAIKNTHSGHSPSPGGATSPGVDIPSAPSGAPPAADPLLREAQLLDQARALLAASPSAALSRLDQHARQFPQGKLGLERELLTIEALRRLGRGAEARARGETLLARSAGTPYEARVRRTLGSAP